LGFSSAFFFDDSDEKKPCLPKVYQSDIGVMSSSFPLSGFGRLYFDNEKELGRIELKLHSIGSSETRNISLIYRFGEGKVYAIQESKFCEVFSITKEFMLPRCLERTASKKNTIILGSNTKCDVWDLKRDISTMKLVIDQTKTEQGEFVPINLIINSRYHGLFFHEFFNFQKKERLGGELFEIPKICRLSSQTEQQWNGFIHLDLLTQF